MEHRHDPGSPGSSTAPSPGTLTEEAHVTTTPAEPIEPSPPQSPPQSFLSSSSTIVVASTGSPNDGSAQSGPQTRSAENHATTAAHRSPQSTLSRLRDLTKATSGDSSLVTWLGVSFKRKETSGGNIWIITISKLGRWIVYLHIALATVSIFNLATTIYSWKSTADGDNMLQKVLNSVNSSGSHLEGIDNEIMKWINATKLHNAEEEARLILEQERWTALLNVFRDCGATQSRQNGTGTCEDIPHFFKTNPLPRPDKSHIAKRNIAELDRIIRRVHLDRKPQLDHEHHPAMIAVTYSLISFSIFAFCCLGYYLVSRFIGVRIRKRSREKVKYDSDIHDEKPVKDTPEDDSVTITATGGDYFRNHNDLHRRNLRAFDPHAAAAKGSVRELEENQGVLNVNNIDKDNEHGTLLTAAAKSGSLETVQYVLSHNPDINAQGGRYQNALQAAAHSGNESIVRHLLRAGARDTLTGGFYGTAINAAAEKGNTTMLQNLLRHYTDKSKVINAPGGSHGHALIAAAARGDQNTVQILLSEGALVNQCDTGGTSALHQAALSSHIEAMEVLLEYGAYVNQLSTINGTPLHAACRGLHAHAAKKLLAADVDLAVRDERQRLPLHEAANAKAGLDEVFGDILFRRADLVDAVDADGATALHIASIVGNAKTVKALLDAGADCSIGDKIRSTTIIPCSWLRTPRGCEIASLARRS